MSTISKTADVLRADALVEALSVNVKFAELNEGDSSILVRDQSFHCL